MEGHGDAVTELEGICITVADLNARLEYRNRVAPVSFCGNRFEFRAVGSSQYVGFPLSVLNTAVAEDLSKLSSVIKGGKSPCDAVKALLEDNVDANLNEDGHSDEWQAFNEDSGAAIRARCEAAGRRPRAAVTQIFTATELPDGGSRWTG